MSLTIGAAALGVNALMHVPYMFNDPDTINGGFSKNLIGLVPINKLTYDPFDRHWWWDNVSHLLWGVSFGALFLSVIGLTYWQAIGASLIVASIWEVYEYVAKERPWHTNQNGDMMWLLDHALEDTLLDTYMMITGVWLVSLV